MAAMLTNEAGGAGGCNKKRGTLCCVPWCNNVGGHKFPSEASVKNAWLKAIRRAGKTPTSKWAPTKWSVVCHEHFEEADYISVTYDGKLQHYNYEMVA